MFICDTIRYKTGGIALFAYGGDSGTQRKIFRKKHNEVTNFLKRRTFSCLLRCTFFAVRFWQGAALQKASQPVLQQIEYSNLADSDTQALLSKLLQDAGVSDLRIQTFFDHVQKFNNAVDPAWLTTGFENAKPSDLKYDPYSMQDAWTEKL